MANTTAGKGAIKALVQNPTARRIVARGVKKAATGAFSAMQSSQGRSQGAGQDRAGSSPPKATPLGAGATTSTVESVARPWAEKLAASGAGRSVLEAINSVTSEALGRPTAQGRSSASPAADTPQSAYRPQPVSDRPKEPKFLSYTPPAGAEKAPPPPPAMKWRAGESPPVETASE